MCNSCYKTPFLATVSAGGGNVAFVLSGDAVSAVIRGERDCIVGRKDESTLRRGSVRLFSSGLRAPQLEWSLWVVNKAQMTFVKSIL